MAEIRKTNIFQYLKTKYNNVASIVKMNGTQSAGSSDYIARADHVHPTDTSRAASNHSHGSLVNDGALNSDITSVNKVAVTDATNKLKTISKLPLDKVTHQDISGKANVNHSHASASSSANGFLSKEDKSKLDGIATEANKTVVDSSLSSSSTNPVQNKVVNSALNGKSNTGHEHTSDEIHYAYGQNVSVTTILENKASTHHTHDDRYYTETEMNTKLQSKSDINHNHNNTYSLLTHHHTGLDGISDIICDSAGQQSVAGYRKVFRLKITKQYFDSPVSFEFVQRKCRQTARVHIIFNSVTSTDPSLRNFTYDGAIEMPIYLYKESASTWVFITKEVSNYDTVNIRFLPLSSSIKNSCTITPINEYLANLPSTNIHVGIPDLTVSTHTLANGATLYKYGKIVMCVLFNVAFSGKTAYAWNNLFTNIPSKYQPIGGTNPIYAHSSEIMLFVQGSSIQIYPYKTSGSVFNTLVWITD